MIVEINGKHTITIDNGASKVDYYSLILTVDNMVVDLNHSTIVEIFNSINTGLVFNFYGLSAREMFGVYIFISDYLSNIITDETYKPLIRKLIKNYYYTHIVPYISKLNRLFDMLSKTSMTCINGNRIIRKDALFNQIVQDGLMPNIGVIAEFKSTKIGVLRYSQYIQKNSIPEILTVGCKRLSGLLMMVYHDAYTNTL